MAEKTFSTMVSEVLTAYPQMIAAQNEVSQAKSEIASTKSTITNELASAKSEINWAKSEIEKSLGVAQAKTELVLENVEKLAQSASFYESSASNYYELSKASESKNANSVLAVNAAKLKAIEAQTKSEVYLSQIQSINASFKNTAKDANAVLKTTALNVTDALASTTDFQLGRMEFKRRQVNAKIHEANEMIERLEDSSALKDIKALLRENLWDHAILGCGMMDVLLSKGVMMFLTIQTQDIKEQTERVAQEVELDRLDIQRQRAQIKTLSEQAKALVATLEAKVGA